MVNCHLDGIMNITIALFQERSHFCPHILFIHKNKQKCFLCKKKIDFFQVCIIQGGGWCHLTSTFANLAILTAIGWFSNTDCYGNFSKTDCFWLGFKYWQLLWLVFNQNNWVISVISSGLSYFLLQINSAGILAVELFFEQISSAKVRRRFVIVDYFVSSLFSVALLFAFLASTFQVTTWQKLKS